MDFTVERHVQLYAVNSQGHGGGERLFAGDRTLRLGFAHRHFDLMLRFDADGFQELADAHIEDFFVHGAPPVLWETAPLILAVCRNARRRGVDAQTLTRAAVGKSVKMRKHLQTAQAGSSDWQPAETAVIPTALHAALLTIIEFENSITKMSDHTQLSTRNTTFWLRSSRPTRYCRR
jgi:hypothetical protein